MRRAIAALLLLATTAPAQEDPSDGIRIVQRLDAQLPRDARFLDEDGREVRVRDLLGRRPVVLALVYYECPMLCTLVLNGLVKALRALDFDAGKEFDVVVVSIDPGETPALARAKKRSYLRIYDRPGAEEGWHFLTGEEAQIRKLADAVGYRYRYVPERDEYAHAAGIAVATPKGRIARYLLGVEYGTRDLKFALMEATEERIGSFVDELILLCFHYDPTTGRYGFAIVSALRIFGILTVAVIAWFVFRALRRERGRAPAPAGRAA